MQDDKAKTESELTKFFVGLKSGLESLREVRSIYDEQVAFEFNSTSFFWPNENKTSEILAFFLTPDENHGQKATFLKLFIKQFELRVPSALLEDLKSIEVTPEDPTSEKRKIDVTIVFGRNEYAIGIENKIGTAKDRKGQLTAYAKELSDRTKDDKKWTLFYLTPSGENPSEDSISKDIREKLVNNENRNLRMISYRENIIDLFGQFEMACKAENVRAFLKDFRQYLKQRHIGETVMGETNFVAGYLREHPEILKHTGALRNAVESLKPEFFHVFWSKVAEHLTVQDITIDPKKMRWDPRGYSLSEVEHSASPFGDQGDLKKPEVIYEPSHRFVVYIAMGLREVRNNWSRMLKEKVAKLEENLKVSFDEDVGEQIWWCAEVALPHPKFNSDEAIYEFLQDKDGSKTQARAAEAANKISKYIEVVESSWREI